MRKWRVLTNSVVDTLHPSRFCCGWMLPNGMESAAQIEQFLAVQVQRCHRCSSYGGASDDL